MVVRPADTAQVAAILRICSDAGVAVVPQGGHTSLVGGATPRGGEVVLSLSRLSGIGAVDAISGEVIVGAGVTLLALQERVRDAGFAFGVDLPSRGSATIGGMVATNAGGINVLRYGQMRAQVIGLEAVLSSSEVIKRLTGPQKDNTGYDISGLLTGSEGTLAVITQVRLRLVPQPAERAAALLAVGSIDQVLSLVSRVRGAVGSLDAAECFLPAGLDLVCAHTGLPRPFRRDYPFYLLLEAAGSSDPATALADALVDAPEVLDSAFATDRPGRQRLWQYRERHTESINAAGVPHKLDVALPLPVIGEFLAKVDAALAQVAPQARAIIFGHIAEGNLHVNLLGMASDDDTATDAVLRLAAGLGGSISAEHGIGQTKTAWLHLTRSPAEIGAMRAIKHALDPSGIMNPGVLLPPQPRGEARD